MSVRSSSARAGPAKARRRFVLGLLGAALYFLLYLSVALGQLNHYARPAGLDLGIAGIARMDAIRILVRALWPVMLETNLILGLFHIGVGFGLGLAAALLAEDVSSRSGWPRSGFGSAALVATTLLLVAVLGFAAAAVRYPFRYDHLLNARGGAYRVFHNLLTRWGDPDVLEGTLWVSIGVLALPVVIRIVGRRPRVAAVAIVVVGLGSFGWSRASAVRDLNRGPNVVLILLESARPDYLSVNGYPHATSPALARLVAEGGVTFPDAWAHANGTVASVVTILSSTYASQHGMRSMFHNDAFVRPGIPRLPELLRANGFATRAVADWDGDVTYFNDRVLPGFEQYDVAEFGAVNYVKQVYTQHFLFATLTDNRWGHRLFTTFYHAGGGYAPAGSDAFYRSRIERHLRELGGTSRFFLTVFFADAHINYRCPHPYYAAFTDPRYAGPNKYQAVSNPQATTGPDVEAAQIRGLYAGCLRAQDDNIGFVVDVLRRLGLDDRTSLVVIGDHGERLPDRASFRYGRNGAWLDPAEFHVPLVIRAPHLRAAARRLAVPARHIDVMPTVLDLVGIPLPPGLEGQSLVPFMQGRPSPRAIDIFGETGFHWVPVAPPYLGYPSMVEVVSLQIDGRGALIPRYFLRPDCVARIDLAKHRFIRRGRYQLNYRPLADGARSELYDVVEDPALAHDIAAERPEIATDLRSRLLEWAQKNPGLVVRGGRLATRDPADEARCAPRRTG